VSLAHEVDVGLSENFKHAQLLAGLETHRREANGNLHLYSIAAHPWPQY